MLSAKPSRAFRALLSAGFLHLLAIDLEGQEREPRWLEPGTRVRIAAAAADIARQVSTVAAVRGDTLILHNAGSSFFWHVQISQIEQLEVRDDRKRLAAALKGGAVGVVGGAAVGVTVLSGVHAMLKRHGYDGGAAPTTSASPLGWEHGSYVSFGGPSRGMNSKEIAWTAAVAGTAGAIIGSTVGASRGQWRPVAMPLRLAPNGSGSWDLSVSIAF